MTPDEAEAEARRMFAIDNSTIEQLHDIALDRNRHMRFYERWMPSVRTRVTRQATRAARAGGHRIHYRRWRLASEST